MIIYMEGLDLTLSILPREGLSNPGLMMNRMAALQQNSGIIGRSTHSALEMSIRLRPRDISRASGMDFQIPFFFITEPTLSALDRGVVNVLNTMVRTLFTPIKGGLSALDKPPYNKLE